MTAVTGCGIPSCSTKHGRLFCVSSIFNVSDRVHVHESDLMIGIAVMQQRAIYRTKNTILFLDKVKEALSARSE